MSPRAIRAFLFRYQLARLLLGRSQGEYDSSNVIAELAKAARLSRGERRANHGGPRSSVESVVRQVT